MINAMKNQQESGAYFDVRWWGLLENVNDTNEVSCVYRIQRDRLDSFLLNFAESMHQMYSFAGVDLNKCEVKFINIEWKLCINCLYQ